MSEAIAPTEGPLSVEQAVSSLLAPAAPEAAVEALEPEQVEPSEVDPNPTEDTSEAKPGDGEEPAETTEAAAVPVDAPQWWDAEARDHFALLTPEAQAVVFAQEEKREAIVSKAKQEAAEERKTAQGQIKAIQQFSEHLGTFLPQAVETFKSRWGEDPDWAAVVQEQGAEAAFVLKAQWEGELQQLQKVAQAKQVADATSLEADQATRDEELNANYPVLGTSEEGSKARGELAGYLLQNGYSKESLPRAAASDLIIAHKAMLFDRAQASLKAAPKPIAAPAKAPAKAPAALGGTSQTRTVAQVANRYAQTRSVDDAVALLLAKG